MLEAKEDLWSRVSANEHEGNKKKDEWWTAENTLTLVCGSPHSARALLSRSRPLGPRNVLLIASKAKNKKASRTVGITEDGEGLVKVV